MNKINSLKNLYGLDYDKSNYQSTLIDWYNRLIDKSADELSVADVSRMVRQNVLRDVAIDRAIELFLVEPFDGEMQDGDLLALLVSCNAEIIKSKRMEPLIAMLLKLENEISNFDWANDNSKILFEKNHIALKSILLQGCDHISGVDKQK